MLNIELQELLQQYPPEAEIKIDGIKFGRCGSYEGDLIDIDPNRVEMWTNKVIVIDGTASGD